jgi:hypothetical protein
MKRFTDHLQAVTTNNYYSIADFHTKSSKSTFTSHCLLTGLNNRYSSAKFFTAHVLATNHSAEDSSASTVCWLTLHSWTLNSTQLLNRTMLTLIFSRHGPHTENTALLLLRACLLGFPHDRYPASPVAHWLMPSNGLDTDHVENTAPVLLAVCLSSNGVFWLPSLMLWANPS